jgi:mono/diheme cytochrome c family protein
MVRRSSALVGLLALAITAGGRILATAEDSSGHVAARAAQAPAPPPGGWTIPPEAKTERNPLQVDDKVLAAGKALFKSKCQRCHGPAGKGDGPDAEPEHQEDMDLTRAERASPNPDGVVFYKVWNGRKQSKMPSFKSEMTKEEVWTIVSYVQTLRPKP